MKNLLIIDGYNFLFSTNIKGDLEDERNRIAEKLISYAAVEGLEILLVFDGKSEQVIKKPNLKIVYTKKPFSADNFIEKLLTKMHLKPNINEDVILVTNDQMTKNLASGVGVRVFSNHWLQSELQSDPSFPA